MSFVFRNCETCGAKFKTRKSYVDRGHGRFCSLKCSANRARKEKDHNCVCSFCEKSFYRTPSKIKSKSGHVFCSRHCKDSAQKIGGIEDIMPSHYGTGTSRYRQTALNNLLESEGRLFCEECGWDDVPEVLEVHHHDRDRNNNSPENLAVLCPTCHRIEHLNDHQAPRQDDDICLVGAADLSV